jgi:hypothetical protein
MQAARQKRKKEELSEEVNHTEVLCLLQRQVRAYIFTYSGARLKNDKTVELASLSTEPRTDTNIPSDPLHSLHSPAGN